MTGSRDSDTQGTGTIARVPQWLGSSPFAGVLVLCVSLSFTARLWWEERDDIARHRQQRFEQVTERVSAELQDRMLAYDDLLQGASGLISALPEVDAGRWHAYFKQLGLDARLQGTQFVGFAPVDPADGSVRLSLVYPGDGENLRASGYRPTDDPSQRAALARARDTGRSALSERSTLPVESELRVQPGFVLYLPVYRRESPHTTEEERRNALAGYVLCALRIHDMLREMRLELEGDAVIDLYDGAPSPGALLFTSRGSEIPSLSEDRQISLGGHAWTLRVGSSPAFDGQPGSRRPLQVLLAGTALSIALAALVLVGARHQRRFLSAHKDLARSHARYLSLVDSVPGTAFRVGPALPWRLEYISEGVSELTGKPPGHWLSSGDFLQELIHPDDLTRVLRVVAWSTASGTPFEVEYRLRAEGAATRWVRQRTRALRGDAGELLGMSGVLTDMTHTRELMDTLSRQRETLEEQVHARTAELLLAKDAAESASIAKSRFLSTMSHELRTPMNAVIGFSTLLAENEQDPARKRQLQRIQGAGKDLLELVNRVLDFARADAGTLALDFARFEVEPILQAASERLRIGVAGRPVSWHVGTVADVPAELVGDGRRIREVLLELVENSLEYTQSGSISVELRTEHHSTGVELAFAVRDTRRGSWRQSRASTSTPLWRRCREVAGRPGWIFPEHPCPHGLAVAHDGCSIYASFPIIAKHKNDTMRRMPAMPPLNASRRRILLGALLAPALIPACGKTPAPLRVGTNIWIGYESLYVAENRGLLARQAIRLITMRNASEVQQALHAGMLEAAAMSLDEALNLVEEGLDLRVVLVMDVSHGADVVLGQPGISTLRDLRGRRVGVETSALGAVMLQACLEAAGLRPEDLQIVDMGIDRHASAFRAGEVDVVVTFEPVRSELLREGATLLFDSSMAPGRIVDVLVVTTDTLERNPEPVRRLVEGHFKAIDYLRADPLRAATIMRPRQQLPPEEIVKAFEGVRIPDVSENHRLLSAASGPPELESNADRLMRLMVEHRLLREPVSVRGLADGRFLPAT